MYIFIQKWAFKIIEWILTDIMPRKWRFWPLLGDIGLFLSPDFGRKLGMDNQLQIYKN
jgi:hypothetical protein